MALYNSPLPISGGPLYRNLHEGWVLRGAEMTVPAQVPGCVHTDLHRAGKIPDPFFGNNEAQLGWIEAAEWIYETTVQVSAEETAQEQLELVFEGLDTLAEIRINGRLAGNSENMFTPLRLDVKPFLKTGANVLTVRFAPTRPYIESRKTRDFWHEWNDVVGGASLVRKMQCNFGWDWGPRLVTAGIWKAVRLEAWTGNRLAHLAVLQTHGDGAVKLELKVETRATLAQGQSLRARVLFDGKDTAVSDSLILQVTNPKLWWPVGQGAQPLYTVILELLDQGRVVDRLERRIGLRTVVLDRHADQWGESFQFLINGRPVFAKGGNWVPVHNFVTEAREDEYEQLLRSCVEANHNMVRAWGGGIYEADRFYELCDELGLMVWQDFMFGCALYRGHEDEGLYRAEFRSQVRRLAHHPSIVLWCGNNELEIIPELKNGPAKRLEDYNFVFNKLIPSITTEEDPQRPYWPCSPHKPEQHHRKGENDLDAGDTHDWFVWHHMKPAEHYETTGHRFVSEFGMQSYPHQEIAETFCEEGELYLNSRSFENHQKHLGGNTKIFHYTLNYFPFPKDHAALTYLSQLNQAVCIRTGVEHWRRSMPRCMGALYWQLNDCWPAASWSSIDFGGRWKALHYESRRFFAPQMVNAVPDGRMSAGHLNYYKNSIQGVNLHTVSDAPQERAASLEWSLFHVDGRELRKGSQAVVLRGGESVKHGYMDLSAEKKEYGEENLVFQARLRDGAALLSESMALLTLPRFVKWQRAAATLKVVESKPGLCVIELSSAVPLYAVSINLRGIPHHAEDNYLHVWPGQPRRVSLRIDADIIVSAEQIQVESLVDARL